MGIAQFWTQAAKAYAANTAHGFLLYGDGVGDYTTDNGTQDIVPTLEQYMTRALGSDLIIRYDPAKGITFPLESMKALFLREVMGQTGQQRGPAGKPALAAVMQGVSNSAANNDIDLRLPLGEALPLLDKAMSLVTRFKPDSKECHKVSVIFNMADLTFPAMPPGPLPPVLAQASAYILNWLRNPIWRSQNAPVIWFIAPSISSVAEVLRSAYAVQVKAPGYEQRKTFAEYALAANGVELEEGMTVHRLAAMTAGLLRINIEDVIVRARVEDRKLSAEMVKERKDEIMITRFSGVLETIEATGALDDIAGLDYLKRFLLSEIVNPMKTGNTAGVPMGVLMAGPPGTGKTYIAEKLAASAGVNFVLLRMSNILGSYVGESEKNLEKALSGIQEMTPCIVFIDEVEQSIRRDSGNSGPVMGNIFGRLINAMADTRNRGKVVWLMATNRPDLLDAAFKRSGRIDAKFAVMPPDNDQERITMFQVMARKNGVVYADSVDLSKVAPQCVDYTGADIEVIVNKARKVARDNGRDVVSQADLDHAVKAIRIAQNAQAKTMIALAIEEVNDLDNLPPSIRQRYLEGEFAAEQNKTADAPTTRGGQAVINLNDEV